MTTQLTSSASVGRSSVLADHLGADSLVKDALMVLAGASLVGVLAQVSVPMWPVPITGQTLGVLLVGAILGARRGALSLLSYMLLGLAGMPWFSAASGGLAALAKPSFGYILGFIPAAWLLALSCCLRRGNLDSLHCWNPLHVGGSANRRSEHVFD